MLRRIMLQDWELGLAVNHAVRFLKPDKKLRQAIVEGHMKTREDVKREITRMLADDSIRKPRILRFFRDYFDYDLAGYICKDFAALGATGLSNSQRSGHSRHMLEATASTDRLIELILAEDKNVLKELLTTQKVVAARNDSSYFGRINTASEKAEELAKMRREEKRLQRKINALGEQIAKLGKQKAEAPKKKTQTKIQGEIDRIELEQKDLAKQKSKIRRLNNADIADADLSGTPVFARVSRPTFGDQSMTANRVLSTVPKGQRMGILTHPSWLVSHSDAMDNHAILRGRWIRERLLGGGIPDVPITVDAMLPDEPESTLRERMRVTREKYCWTCHDKMDPLGLPFERYNHAGVYRSIEQGKAVDTSGEIIESGDPELDGPVKGPIEMIQRLAESERVEQVFVRHAFRFWMGRNETVNDAPALQAAHQAYRTNGGSMKALITSLVTSDAFLYRKVR